MKRFLCPCPDYQTSVFLSGPPSSGKSLFIKILSDILKDRIVHVKINDLLQSFERERLKDAWVVVASELEEVLTPRDAAIVKAFTERDQVSYQKKYQQSKKDQYFAFKGILIFQSKSTIEEIFPADSALYSRFIQITFPNTTFSKAGGSLQGDLSLAIPDMVAWALTAPESIVKDHVRAISRSKKAMEKYNYLIDFLATHYTFSSPDGYVTVVDVKKAHGLYLRENNVTRKECDLGKIAVIAEIIFGRKIIQKRMIIGCSKRSLYIGMKPIASDEAVEITSPLRIEIEALQENPFGINPPFPMRKKRVFPMSPELFFARMTTGMEPVKDEEFLLAKWGGSMATPGQREVSIKESLPSLETGPVIDVTPEGDDQEEGYQFGGKALPESGVEGVRSPPGSRETLETLKERRRVFYLYDRYDSLMKGFLKDQTIDGSFQCFQELQGQWVRRFEECVPPRGLEDGVPYEPSRRFDRYGTFLAEKVAHLSQIHHLRRSWDLSHGSFTSLIKKNFQEIKVLPPPGTKNGFYTASGKELKTTWVSAFHQEYNPQRNGHPRFAAVPGNSVTGMPAALKSAVLQDIVDGIGKGYICEVDMAGIHLRVAASVLGPTKAPTLHHEIKGGADYWHSAVSEIKGSLPTLENIEFSDFKKMLKRLVYEPLNGGNPLRWDLELFKKMVVGNSLLFKGKDSLLQDFYKVLTLPVINDRIWESRLITLVLLDPQYKPPST